MNCLTCNYDRTGIDNNKPCPECGAPAPHHHRVARDRYFVHLAIRGIATVVLALATWHVLQAAAGILLSDSWGSFDWADAMSYLAYEGLTLTVIAVLLWVLATPISRLLVLQRAVPPIQHPGWPTSGPLWLARSRSRAEIGVRFIGALAAGVALLRLTDALYAFIAARREARDSMRATATPEVFDLNAWIVYVALPLAATAVVWLFSAHLARWIIPDSILSRCLSCGVALDKNNPPDTCPDCGWEVRTHKTTQSPAVASSESAP